ncbi:MCE family protein [Actinocorallia sp. API 0066]|uniref:MCE family protein n=1 Tax=Actinocorallia sp. API 0066 TaxID=2896846 RepID=UPI001E3D2E97|nr:MCE family protein [Actinocorallia sp. API 0066]MCD0451447.1 MCE family protein [Actinocorallia sp. API 0066]
MRLLGLLVGAALAAGCAPGTLGAPTGDVTLVAAFADVQNLVAGHSVQLSDITIGSVERVRRVGYQAEVRFSIENDYRLPAGTGAEIAQTSLLGENYVKLLLPEGSDMATGPFLKDGDRITRTSVAPQFEQVAGNAGRLLTAISGDDLATVVNEAATALDGQGPTLNRLISQSADLVAVFAEQRADLGKAIDRLAELGETLAKHNNTLASGDIARATALLAQNKGELLDTVEALTETARRLNDKVFVGRAERLRLLIKRLDPTLATLGEGHRDLSALVKSLAGFQETFPKSIWDGQLITFGAIRLGVGKDAGGDHRDAHETLPLLDQILPGGGR